MEIIDEVESVLQRGVDFHKSTIENIINLVPAVIIGLDSFFHHQQIKTDSDVMVLLSIVNLNGDFVFSGYILPAIGTIINADDEIYEIEDATDQFSHRQIFKVLIDRTLMGVDDPDLVTEYLIDVVEGRVQLDSPEKDDQSEKHYENNVLLFPKLMDEKHQRKILDSLPDDAKKH